MDDAATATSVVVGPFDTRVAAAQQLKALHPLVQPKAFLERMIAPGQVASAVAQFLQEAHITGLFED